MICECGCGWEGQDEVAQWLVEEAVALKARALDAQDTGRTPEQREADELLARHAELLALKDRSG